MFNPNEDTGTPQGHELIAFSNAVLGDDVEILNTCRNALNAAMNPEAVIAASITAGVFSMVDRAANAIGINVEEMVLKPSMDFREQYGINQFPSAANSLG
ncbi:MAG: hypothetical protein VCB59_04390 [Gammaproteobacteria bacterium]